MANILVLTLWVPSIVSKTETFPDVKCIGEAVTLVSGVVSGVKMCVAVAVVVVALPI